MSKAEKNQKIEEMLIALQDQLADLYDLIREETE